MQKSLYEVHQDRSKSDLDSLEKRIAATEAKGQFYFRLALTSLLFPVVILLISITLQVLVL